LALSSRVSEASQPNTCKDTRYSNRTNTSPIVARSATDLITGGATSSGTVHGYTRVPDFGYYRNEPGVISFGRRIA